MTINSLKITTFCVLSASFAVITSGLLIKENFQRVLGFWGESLQMTVYLKENIDSSSAQVIQERLKNDDRIEKLEYVSSENALTKFRDQMQSYASDLVNDKELIRAIPASFQFSMSSKFSPLEQVENMKKMAEQLVQDPQVEDVHYGQDWVSSYSQLFNVFNGTGAIVLAILFLGAFFMIANSIRSSIHSRREEIEILELIGATAFYIRRPFLLESIVMSLAAAVTGMLFCLGLFVFIKDAFNSQISFFQVAQFIHFLQIRTVFAILLVAAFAGWLAAMLCLKNLNNGWALTKKLAEAR